MVAPIVSRIRAIDPGASATQLAARRERAADAEPASRTSSGASVENMWKYTEKVSPRSSHFSAPNSAIATNV